MSCIELRPLYFNVIAWITKYHVELRPLYFNVIAWITKYHVELRPCILMW